MSPDVHGLAGAYALDALPEFERAKFERHLVSCAVCREEVEGLRATATRLGRAVPEPPTADLRNRVLAQIDVTRQQPPAPPIAVPQSRRASRRWLRILSPVAAAAAAAVITFGLVNQQAQVDDMPMDDLTAVLSAPDAHTVPLETVGRLRANIVTAPSMGQALLAVTGMDELDGAAAYVVWTYRNGTPIREQPLEAGDTMVMLENLDQVSEIVLTIEPDPEDNQPSGPWVARAALT